jgi:hypothetical protein
MFWSTPKCPVEEDDKLWLEESMEWLLEEFGADAFREVKVVLPTDEFFPDSYSADEDDARALVDRVCEYMSVNPDLIQLEFFEDEGRQAQKDLVYSEGSTEGACGHYRKRRDKFVIALESSQLTDPMSLVATIAHELGHVRLLGEGRVHGGFEDHEPLTDLLTVFFGLGVFTAHSAFTFDGSSQGWQARTRGYLSEEMFGYALALFALMRGERNPVWSRYVEGSVGTFFKNGLKYLDKTGEGAGLRQLVLQSV